MSISPINAWILQYLFWTLNPATAYTNLNPWVIMYVKSLSCV